METVSNGLGTGLVRSIEGDADDLSSVNYSLNLPNRQYGTLTIDLNLVPSALMVSDPNNPEAEPVEFPWHCEKGLSSHIETVKQEFCEVNNLRPMKIFITGKPLTGKSHYGAMLAEEYNIPHIKIKDLINEIETSELEEEVVTQAREYRHANPGKRYPDELLCAMVRWRLNQNDAQLRGFILDGFPRSYADAKEIFFYTPKKEKKEGEGEGDEEPPAEEGEGEETSPFQLNIYPESVILLRGDDNELKAKAKILPQHVLRGAHYFEKDMERRID